MTGVARDLLADWWVHDTTVERLTGRGPSGSTLGPKVGIRGKVDQKVRTVRSGTGEEVTSTTTVYYPAGTPIIPSGSFITVPQIMGGRRTKVIGFAVHDAGPLETPNHLEVMCE